MILLIECIIGCLIFGTFIILSVLKNKEMWFHEYPESVQERYIELHLDSNIKQSETNLLSIKDIEMRVNRSFQVEGGFWCD